MYNLVFFIKQVALNRDRTDLQVGTAPPDMLTVRLIYYSLTQVKVLNSKGQLKTPTMMKLPY